MSRLIDLQRDLAAALFDAERRPPASLKSHSGEQIDARFAVYRRNVNASLIQVVEQRYPVVARLVGEGFFRAMAARFVTATPPRSPALVTYGGDFPAYIESFAPAADLPYLADVARLEWLQHEAYHAADAEPATTAELASLPAERLADVRFAFHPSLRLLSSPFPVIAIWRTNTHDAEVAAVDLARGGEDALIVRPRLEVEINRLPAGVHGFVSDLMELTLGSAAERARSRNVEFDLQSALSGLVASGAIVGATLDG